MTEISYIAHCLRWKHNHVLEVASASFFCTFYLKIEANQPPRCGFYLGMMTGQKILSVHKNVSFMCKGSALIICAIRGIF